MKLPDKVYLEKPKGCTGNLIGYAYKENRGLYDLSPIEYIRKEAILEWAKEWHERYPYSHEFEMIIDKIESL